MNPIPAFCITLSTPSLASCLLLCMQCIMLQCTAARAKIQCTDQVIRWAQHSLLCHCRIFSESNGHSKVEHTSSPRPTTPNPQDERELFTKHYSSSQCKNDRKFAVTEFYFGRDQDHDLQNATKDTKARLQRLQLLLRRLIQIHYRTVLALRLPSLNPHCLLLIYRITRVFMRWA